MKCEVRGERGEGKRRTRERGMMLIDCLAYIALLAMILGLTVLAFFRASDNTRNLHRDVADIARALNAGERWREDVRAAASPPRIELEAGASVLRLRHPAGDVSYVFRDGTVWRRGLPNTNWLPVLPAIKASIMRPQARTHVTSWAWDVELNGCPRTSGSRPVFSFQAVAKSEDRP